MEYKNYHRDIIMGHEIELIGWPNKPPRSPGSMGTSLPVFVKLLKALDCGDCYFRDLSKDEMKALDDAHEASVAAGEVETRVRKIRSDAGKPKGKKRVRDDDSQSESDSDDEDAPAL